MFLCSHPFHFQPIAQVTKGALQTGTFTFQISKKPSLKIHENRKGVFCCINSLLWKIKTTDVSFNKLPLSVLVVIVLGPLTQPFELCCCFFCVCCNIWFFYFLSMEFSLLFSYISDSLLFCETILSPLPVCHSMSSLSVMFIPCSSLLSLIYISSCVKLMCQSMSLFPLLF